MAKPQILLRAEQERIDLWKAAAGDVPFNRWAGDILDTQARLALHGLVRVASAGTPAREAEVALRRAAAPSDRCPQARFHRPGTFCKACGLTP